MQYHGNIIGVWETGIPEFGIDPGDSFTWQYVYESPTIDFIFDFSSDNFVVEKVALPGTENWDSFSRAGAFDVLDGQVSAAAMSWVFERSGTATAERPGNVYGHFGFGFSGDFTGWGNGSIVFTDPVPMDRAIAPVTYDVPDSGATSVLLMLALGLLAATRWVTSLRPKG